MRKKIQNSHRQHKFDLILVVSSHLKVTIMFELILSNLNDDKEGKESPDFVSLSAQKLPSLSLVPSMNHNNNNNEIYINAIISKNSKVKKIRKNSNKQTNKQTNITKEIK